MRLSSRLLFVPLAAATAVAGLAAGPAAANHSWGGYHWARTSNPFTLKLGDNVTSQWDSILGTTSSDWSKSTVLDTTIVGGATAPKKCTPTSGMVQVCNAAYGYRGWLGVAQVWVNGSHITQGTVKLNDSYFAPGSSYDNAAWRNLVSCQEVGHTLGLDHQDENFDNANLGTCMDYTNNPGTNQHPNQHDYDQLQSIYSHTDSSTTVGAAVAGNSAAGAANSEAEWGQAIRTTADGRPDLFVRDVANNQRVFTFVIWAN